MPITDIFRVNEIKAELEKAIKERNALRKVMAETDKMEYHQLKQAIADLNAQKEKARLDLQQFDDWFAKRKQNAEQQMSEVANQIELRKKQIIVLDEEILLESFALYKPQFKFQTSEEYRLRLDTCRDKQKQLIKDGIAVKANEAWTVNNSKSEGKKMVNDMKKLLLRSFNNECDYCVDNVKFNNMEVNEKRIEKSFEELNKLGRIMQANISDSYKKLKYEELYLAFEYQQKKQEEKEEQKRAWKRCVNNKNWSKKSVKPEKKLPKKRSTMFEQLMIWSQSLKTQQTIPSVL